MVVFIPWRWLLNREINARIAAIHAEGLPANWDDLAKWPAEVPDGENAALIYTNAIGHLHRDGVTENYRFDLPERGKIISAKTNAILNGAVKTNQEALQIIYSATKFQKSRYPLGSAGYAFGPGTEFPQLYELRCLVKLLGCEAITRVESGDAEGATKAIESSFNVANSLEGEPVLISQLTGISCLKSSCQSLEWVLGRVPLPNTKLKELSAQVIAAEKTNHILTGLIGERAMCSEFIRIARFDLKTLDIPGQTTNKEQKVELPARNPSIVLGLTGFFARDQNFFLQAMETNLAVTKLGPPASFAWTNQAPEFETNANKGFYLLSGLLLPALNHTMFSDANLRAELRVTQAGLAIEQWRGVHQDSLPDSLQMLVPDFLPTVPTDPFDGQPLRFKKLNHGYVVYSIGPDLRDDGGKEKPPGMIRTKSGELIPYDVTFIVER